MAGTNGNKRRRLAASENVQHELAVSESSQHSRVIYSSNVLTASPSHAIVATSMATSSSCISSGTLSPQMVSSGRDNQSEVSYSVDAGKNKMSLMTDIIHDKSSDEMISYTINDGHLMDVINSRSSNGAVALLNTQENSSTQDRLNQALISACRRGHKLLAQTLVQVDADTEHQDENGNTPLLICADRGFTDIVRFLVSMDANVNARNSSGNTALILSVCPAGSTDLTKFLLEQQDVDIHHENQDGDTALNRATQLMDVDTMRLLLEKSLAPTSDREDREVSKVHVITHDTDKCFFNSRAQEIQQELIVAKAGLADVYEMLKEHVITGTSPLELAIKAHDTKSLDIFLDCQWSSSSDKKRYVDKALMYMFRNSGYESVHRFSDTEVTIIQSLLQYMPDVNRVHWAALMSHAVESGHFKLVESMCTRSAKLNRDSYSGKQDPLCIAAKNGRQDLIELLLKYGSDINRSSFSESALNYALKNDHTECAKLLIQRGANMDVACALRSAVEQQRPNYMRFVFENYKRDFMDFFSQQTFDARKLLISAAEKGNSDIIGQILDAGVDVNEADSSGQTPLMAAKNRAVTEFLIQRGANINQIVDNRNSIDTQLSYLIKNRKCVDASTVELCKFFIDNGAMVNCRSGEGETPLMMAASQADCVSMLEMLLDNGADVTGKDTKGNTALLHAITNGYSKNASCLLSFSRNRKSAINIQNNEGLTPLIISVMKRNVAIMKELIEEGADVNMKDNNENTVLHHLMLLTGNRFNLQNSKDILTSLLKAGSHVNCQNSKGLSPLMLAAKKSRLSLMSILLDAGADVNAVCKNNHSQTAISFLSETTKFSNVDILCIELLLERGASASYLIDECLHKLIFQDKIHVIPKLIQRGVGPADIWAGQIRLKISFYNLPSLLSPLCAALLHGHISLARYFMDIQFLTRSDLSMFADNRIMERLLKLVRQGESWNFLQELSSQPMSLDKLCLVAVAAAVGSSSGREARVDSLPLPQMMKDRLLFKSIDDKHHVLIKMHPEHRTTSKRSLLPDDDTDDDDYY